MKHLSLSLLVTLFAVALVGCGKKPVVKQAEPAKQAVERVSGTHADVIAWEAEDLK